MPAGLPPNLTAATAHPLTALNYAYVTDPAPTWETFSVPEVTDLWFVRTAVATEVAMGWRMTTSDQVHFDPIVSIYTGTPSALVAYGPFTGAGVSQTLQIPVTPGTTYYFKVENGVSPSVSVDVTLNIYASYAPGSAAPIGSLLINADADLFPAILLDATGTVVGLQFAALPQGESGAVLPDGTIMVQNQTTNHPEIWAVVNGALTRTVNVTGLTVPGMVIGSDRSANFYVASPSTRIVSKVSKTGVVSGTTYGPLATGISYLQAKADNSILYYHTSGASAITTWTTATNLAGADFAAAVAGYNPADILVMSDASVVIGYNKADNTVTKLYQYSAAGATVHAYTLDTNSFNHSVQAPDDPVSVWVWFRVAGGIDKLEQITLSSGVASKTLALPLVSAAGVVPAGYQFGTLGSCPLLILPGGPSVASLPLLPMAQPTEVGSGVSPRDPIRVVRRWQLPFETNLQVFLSRLEILIQSGVGLTAPTQGDDPTIMLKISRDGGKTWGNEQWRGMGKIGEYLARPYWNRLGRGRNLVAEIVCTDPVFVAFLDAFVDAEVGSS